MILYCDSSALIKHYVSERGSVEIQAGIERAEVVGINAIGCVEIVATFAKLIRMRRITKNRGLRCLNSFRDDQSDIAVSEIGKETLSLAEQFAWGYQLRGYDSVHQKKRWDIQRLGRYMKNFL